MGSAEPLRYQERLPEAVMATNSSVCLVCAMVCLLLLHPHVEVGPCFCECLHSLGASLPGSRALLR